MIKAADFIAQCLVDLGVRHVFAITGGASIHLIHSLGERQDIDFVCPHHEQAAAMAADAYSRLSGGLGCALATSGPGATNLVTGIASAWFDSVPVLYLTGQVARFRYKGETGVRQMGFQETDVLSIVQSITKYAVQVNRAEDLLYEIAKAVHIAKSGRPGPVLVDIPDDLQREIIDPTQQRHFVPPMDQVPTAQASEIQAVINLLMAAKRPVLVLGHGIRAAGGVSEALALVERLQIPVCPSWAALDFLPSDHPLLVGSFGTHGSRAGNFAIQNADLVIAIGARLSTRETGSPPTNWARGAKIVLVDIDLTELRKLPAFGKVIDHAIHADARKFIDQLLIQVQGVNLPSITTWLEKITSWRMRYPSPRGPSDASASVNPYRFMDLLSAALEPGDLVISDTGCAIAWATQSFHLKTGQRLVHAFNNTPMGYALPGAIGAAFAARDLKRIICLAGDGSLMMNMQELATVRHHDLPIKLFVMNNDGYAMVQQTQEQWLGARYFATATGPDGGLSFPNFGQLAGAFSIASNTIRTTGEIETAIGEALSTPGPFLCDVHIPSTARVEPQSRFGFPLEDSEPLLPRAEFLDNMIVPALDVSLKAKV